MNSLEAYEMDEVIIAIVIFLGFYLRDLHVERKNNLLAREKLKIYRAMLSSTQHVLNNYLNQMQIFKMRAKSTPEFPQETLDLYDSILQETQQKIDALSKVREIDEQAIRESVSP